MNGVFPEKLIGGRGPIAWPSHSPEPVSIGRAMVPCKTVVYSSKPHSLDELKVIITNTIHDITQQQLENVFNKLENQIE